MGTTRHPATPKTDMAVLGVWAAVWAAPGADYENLREGLGKLRLNDASLKYEPETSSAMGFGFRCGFLGLLHMDVVQERLEREYGEGGGEALLSPPAHSRASSIVADLCISILKGFAHAVCGKCF